MPRTKSLVSIFLGNEDQYRSCTLCSKKLKYCESTFSFVWHLTQKHSKEYSKHITLDSFTDLELSIKDRDTATAKNSILDTKSSIFLYLFYQFMKPIA